jgi:hypothetical protein
VLVLAAIPQSFSSSFAEERQEIRAPSSQAPKPSLRGSREAEAHGSDDTTARKNLLKLYDFDEYSRRSISFYYCQAGFPTHGSKPIVIWTRERFPSGTASLRCCATGKTVPVPLRCGGVNIWGRQDWIADCSRVTEEGEYTLRAEFGGQSAETAPFAISNSCYADLREKAAKHFFLKRCGIFCHTHDGNLYSLKPDTFGKVLGHVPAFGGWHDAHNDDKWMWLVWSAVYGLLKTQDRFTPAWRGSNEPYPYCLAEAWWEVQWLLRMQKPDGTFYYSVCEWFPELAKHDGDRMILTIHHTGQHTYDDLHGDRRVVLDVWEQDVNALMGTSKQPIMVCAGPKYFAYTAHVLRYCGRLMRRYNQENAQRCAVAADKTIAYLENIKAYPPFQELEVYAGLALYWLEEARDGGGRAALAKAEGYLKRILARQQPGGHFHASTTCRGLEAYPEEGEKAPAYYYPFGYMAALIEYLEYAQQDGHGPCTLADGVKSACLRFAGMLEKFCDTTVFRQPSEMRFDRTPALIMPLDVTAVGYNPYILSAGTVFAAAERLTGYPGGRELGRRQLYWVLGANPRFTSFMNQVGVRNSGQYAAASSITYQYYPMAFYRHLRDMRWGITCGMYGSPNAMSALESWQVASTLPNYPCAGESMHGKYNSSAQETWINCNGWLLLLLAQLEP